MLGNGRSKLYANYGKFYARIPNDLAARALSADDGVSRADYFDAALTRPIANGIPTQQSATAGVITQHLAVAGVGADAIDPETKLSSKYEFVAGYEYEVAANTSIGVRYIRRCDRPACSKTSRRRQWSRMTSACPESARSSTS